MRGLLAFQFEIHNVYHKGLAISTGGSGMKVVDVAHGGGHISRHARGITIWAKPYPAPSAM